MCYNANMDKKAKVQTLRLFVFGKIETDGEVRVPSEKSLENLKKGKATQFSGDVAAINQKKSAESRKKNIAARKAFKDALALMAGDVLSDAQIEKLRKRGINPDDKTLMELGAAATIMQWLMGDMKAGALAMEISGNDNAAEQRKIERERLALEKERISLLKTADDRVDRVAEIMAKLDEEAKADAER